MADDEKPLSTLWSAPTDPVSVKRAEANELYQKVTEIRPRGKKGEKPKRKTLADRVREATDDNQAQVEFFTMLANGEIDGATVGDRIIANKWLADRGAGKAPDIQVQAELEDKLEDVSSDEIRALLRSGEK